MSGVDCYVDMPAVTASTFVVSSDGHGGRLIVDPPANPKQLLAPTLTQQRVG
jgi:hypothetical protein